MTANFAGSRSLDDRRRRRIAQETAEQSPSINRKKMDGETQEVHDRKHCDATSVKGSDVVSDESLIPSSPWKVYGFGVFGLVVWTLLTLVGADQISILQLDQWLAKRINECFHLFDSVCLILGCQLLFTIYWYRSRSRKDFSGRYRVWAWAGTFWVVSGILQLTGLYRPLADSILEKFPLHCWRPEVLYWFTPFAVGVLTFHQLLSMDIRHSKQSRIFWRSTLALGSLCGGLVLGLDRFLDERIRALTITGASTLWHFLVAFTLLVHARFVVHVTNEAAPKANSRIQRLRNWLDTSTRGMRQRYSQFAEQRRARNVEAKEQRQQLREQRRLTLQEKKAEKQLKQQQEKAEKKKSKELKVEAKKTDASKDPRTSESKSGKAASQSSKKPRTSKKTSTVDSAPRRTQRKRVLGNRVRIDAEHENSSPKTVERDDRNNSVEEQSSADQTDTSKLSKKERRRLRKLEKEKRRAATNGS